MILDYFIQIALAIEYIHFKQVMHRDIKPANFFLSKNNRSINPRRFWHFN
jgi:NIMA (never in mitosis gene a)-related kinase